MKAKPEWVYCNDCHTWEAGPCPRAPKPEAPQRAPKLTTHQQNTLKVVSGLGTILGGLVAGLAALGVSGQGPRRGRGLPRKPPRCQCGALAEYETDGLLGLVFLCAHCAEVE